MICRNIWIPKALELQSSSQVNGSLSTQARKLDKDEIWNEKQMSLQSRTASYLR